MNRDLARLACIVIAALGLDLTRPPAVARAADYEPGTPSTYLFDTVSPSPAARAAGKLDPKTGWKLVPEDNVTHKFQGDAVVLNDRLLVVLRSAGSGAEVYGQTPAGPKQRVELSPRTVTGRKATSLASVRIVDNGPAAVTLAASFTTEDGGSCSLTYRLTAGQMIVEVRPGEGTGRLLAACPTRYVVIPDYFGSDMVFGPETFERPRLRLPAENFFLNMTGEGDAEVMCVCQSSKQEAAAIRSGKGKDAAITGCEIEAVKDKPVWIACLEGAQIWCEQTLATPQGVPTARRPWNPPFPAKWRIDGLWETGETISGPSGDDRWLGTSGCQAKLCYAMDRSQETPLAFFTPMDVLRNTLGVGPCQYILQTEGLATDTNPTPDNVMTFVEKQFKRKKEKKSAAEIRDLLRQMVIHIDQVRARAHRYLCAVDELQEMHAAEAASRPPGARASAPKWFPQWRMQWVHGTGTSLWAPSERAAQLADKIIALIGTDGAARECERLGAELRAIGAGGDGAMATCRMRLRWLKQAAAMYAEDHPDDAELAKKVLAKAEEMLQTK